MVHRKIHSPLAAGRPTRNSLVEHVLTIFRLFRNCPPCQAYGDNRGRISNDDLALHFAAFLGSPTRAIIPSVPNAWSTSPAAGKSWVCSVAARSPPGNRLSSGPLEAVHQPSMIANLEQMAAEGGGLVDSDTVVAPESVDVAKFAAGAGPTRSCV